MAYGFCEDYLKNFARGAHVDECNAKMTAFDDQQWDIARGKVEGPRRERGIAAYERYLKLLPKGRHITEARAAIDDIQKFDAAKRANTSAAIEAYIKAFPAGHHNEEAKSLLVAVLRRESERAEEELALSKKECADYSKRMMSLAEANLTEAACNLPGQRWMMEAQVHTDWCMRAKPEDRWKEIKDGQAAIDSCTAPRREREAWTTATNKNEIAAFNEFLQSWPKSANASLAQDKIVSLCELRWQQAKKIGSWRELTAFITGNCKSANLAAAATEVRSALDERAWNTAKAAAGRSANTLSVKNAYKRYLIATGSLESNIGDFIWNIYVSDGKYSYEAGKFIHEMESWEAVEKSKKPEDYASYLQNYPNGRFASIARSRTQPPMKTQPSTKVQQIKSAEDDEEIIKSGEDSSKPPARKRIRR